MQIRHVFIQNFRGIKKLDWTIQSPVVCLIGPGDSTKTTILDAIEFALSPKWNLTFEDCDFYLGNTDNPIEITVTVGQVPTELIKDDKFGLYTQGWNPIDGVHDSLSDEQVLSIRLQVSNSLEPEWTVINAIDLDGRPISSRDREKLGMNRLGIYIDKHLYWGQGSALSNLTVDKRENASPVIVQAHRMARESAKIDEIQEFKDTISQAEYAARALGVKPKGTLRAALDPRAINIGLGAITIHDDNIPIRLSGLGSRRLITLGIQLSCVEDGSPLLVDEIENGLEPHRIRHFLQYLQDLVNKNLDASGQVIMTSHSATVIVALAVENLHVVRSKDGDTTVTKASGELQGTVRKVPESLLGQKIVVCEGKTELGILQSMESYWISNKSKESFAYNGTVLVDGGGSDQSLKVASELARLGYSVCCFIDGDKLEILNKNIRTMESSGVSIFHWVQDFATETRITSDFTWDVLKDMIDLAVKNFGEESVYAVICNELGQQAIKIGKDLDTWLANGITEKEIRTAISKASIDKNWFKRIDFGEELGKLIIKDISNLRGKDTMSVLCKIEDWIYG
jgi:putative ATP-dependent endonuclease of the OLD family